MTNDHPDRRLRHAVQLEALVTRADGVGHATAVTNLSLDGCCVTGHFSIGEFVALKIKPIGQLRGQIRWAFAGKAGVRFVKREAEATAPR